jgi:hypothetical protein
MATRLRQDKPWQFYDDLLVGPVWPTPADPDDQTDGSWVAQNATHGAEVPTSVPAVEAGHPGLVEFAFKTDGSATQTVNMRVGKKAQLKDWARFGFTCKATWSGSATGFYVGLGDDSNPEETVFFYDLKETANDFVVILAGVDLGEQYVEIGNESWAYGQDLAIQYDLLKEDWHSYEFDVDYPSRTITFYIDGVRKGSVLVSDEDSWELELRPFFQFKYPKDESVVVDEVGFTMAGFQSAALPEEQITASRTLRPGTTRTDNR